jgi:dihydrofolate reductase
MRKLIYAMSVSIDGVIESADGDLRWSFPDAELHRHFNELDSTIDTYLYGRRLYENMVAYWPTADENPSAADVEIEYARNWKQKKKIVFSKTPTQVEWNSQLFRGVLAEEIKALKALPGKDMSVGGANLTMSFIRLGLIDEYRLYVFPIILGSGRRMFPPLPNRIGLQLIDTRKFSSGVVLLKLANPGTG